MKRVLLDANLLVLLIVGIVDRQSIPSHRRTRNFTSLDFDLLTNAISKFQEIILCPNVVTEASNLLDARSGGDKRYAMALAGFIYECSEKYVKSVSAVSRPEYLWLGLTDAVLLALADIEGTLLTTDAQLYEAAGRAELEAINFSYLQLGALN